MKNYYTIFLGEEMFTNVIDDMNSTEDWSEGGMVWEDVNKAVKCMNHLQDPDYDIESDEKKLSIRVFKLETN